MDTAQVQKTSFHKRTFVIIATLLFIWAASQAASQIGLPGGEALVFPAASAMAEESASSEPAVEAMADHDLTQAVDGETEEARGWFIVDDESQWADEERIIVEQVMERTWESLESVGLDGESLLAGYRFRRLAGEFIPGQERLLAVVNHETKEIVLADGAFKRLHSFYVYHELGHAVDQQLGRLPSEAYHQLANAGRDEQPTSDGEAWVTTTGFWLRTNGRDDREEATADAFAWWVMAQADQPQPFFPGTPATTDYGEIARTMGGAMQEAAATGDQPA